jgi:hypothetical protein
MINFKAYLTEEIQPGQAIMAHEPNDKQSLSVNNPVLVAKINSVFTIELGDIFLSPESGF